MSAQPLPFGLANNRRIRGPFRDRQEAAQARSAGACSGHADVGHELSYDRLRLRHHRWTFRRRSGERGALPWTIRCVEISGPQRVQQIQQYTETLRNTPGIRAGDVFFRDEEDGQARLYYGSYRRRADPKTGKRPIPRPMQQDLDLLRSLGGPDGKRYFSRAIPSRVPQPDVGNPEWRLESAAGAYSLQVAAFGTDG